MSDYTKIVDYAAKDALITGNPVKLVKGTELGAEYDAIAVAIATKANTASPAFTGVSSFAVGAVGAPSIYMTGYATTGWYNIGANNWGFAVSGAKVLDIASTGLSVTGTLSSTGDYKIAGTGIYNATATNTSLGLLADTNAYAGIKAYGSSHATKANVTELLAGTGVIVGSFSSTGLAVTGEISATGNISASSVSLPDGNVVTWGAGTTTYIQGNQASAYMNFRINSVNRMALTSAGLAVTGALSASSDVEWSGAVTQTSGSVVPVSTVANTIGGSSKRTTFTQNTDGSYVIDNDVAGNGSAPRFVVKVGTVEKASISPTGLAVTGATTSSGGFVGSSTTSVAVNGTGSSLMLGYIGSAITSTTDAFVSWMPDTHALNPAAVNGSLLVAARNTAGAEVVLVAENAVRARVSSTGLAVTGTTSTTTGMAVGGATAGAGGIAFPATAVAVADVNTLDDYEEGTFSPGISFGGGTTGITYSNQVGSYTKIGNRVICSIYLTLTNKGSSTGAALITGLPFTISNSIADYSAVALRPENISFADVPVAYGQIGTTTIALQEITNAGALSDLANTDFVNNSALIAQFTYRA